MFLSLRVTCCNNCAFVVLRASEKLRGSVNYASLLLQPSRLTAKLTVRSSGRPKDPIARSRSLSILIPITRDTDGARVDFEMFSVLRRG